MIRSTLVKRIVVLTALIAAVSVIAGGCSSSGLNGAVVRTTDTVIKTTVPHTTEAPVSDKINITAVPSKTSVKAGDTFDITIKITSDKPNRGAQFVVTWDPAKVSCVSVSDGGYYKDFAIAHDGDILMLPTNPTADNTIGQFPKLSASVKQFAVAMTGAQGTGGTFLGPTGTGDVMVLHMTAKAGASGSVEFKISDAHLVDATADSNTLYPKINNATISVTP